MDGKFRVKEGGGGETEAPPTCAGTAVESINRRFFHDFREAFQCAQSSFCLADWL
jgi:hypothetical protein